MGHTLLLIGKETSGGRWRWEVVGQPNVKESVDAKRWHPVHMRVVSGHAVPKGAAAASKCRSDVGERAERPGRRDGVHNLTGERPSAMAERRRP